MVAFSIIESGVPINFKRYGARKNPKIPTKTPMNNENMSEVCKTFSAVSFLFAPLAFPKATLAPTAIETKNATIRLISAEFDPTADIELFPPPNSDTVYKSIVV